MLPGRVAARRKEIRDDSAEPDFILITFFVL
jgi:hypothetical protein